ncbi:MAG: LpqB family beta-propeller domain-containing protein [Planctomycetota bacterium]
MRLPLWLFAAIAAAALAPAAPTQSKLLRFPDVHGDRVVFTHGGDLWLAPLAGGTATRLTSADGVELFAKFSPDGQWIAFTGQVDGDEQVYLVPAAGGEIRQLTFYPSSGPLPDRWGYDNQVQGWTPDGQSVVFRGMRESWSPARCRLYSVAVPAAQPQRGALPVALPMPTAGSGAFSPDGNLIVYSPLFRDFRTWKRYQGGWAQDLYVFAPATGMAENITADPNTDRDPMWLGDRIWFCSDRTGTLNLWSYDQQAQQSFQETFSTTWDVRWPSAAGPGEERIVYEKGGELHWFDCKERQEHAIAIRVPDEGLLRRESLVPAQGLVEDYTLSAGGRRAAFAARGDVLTVPYEHGDVRNLTRSPGAHDRAPSFSPDGSQVVFVSDRGGDEQLWLVDHLGREEPTPLTDSFGARLLDPTWSPDGKRVVFCDKDGVLRVVEVATREVTVVADEPSGTIQDASWSPCSQHLAFSLTGANDLPAVHVWSAATGTLRRVSRPLSNDFAPSWSPDGERLFFCGLRGFQPRLARYYEWDFQVDRAVGVYALALRKDLGPWLPVRSDEAVAEEKGEGKGKGKGEGEGEGEGEGGDAAAPPTAIDFDGLADRVETIPVPLDDYAGVVAADGGLWLLRGGDSYYGRAPQRQAALQWFAREDRKLETVCDGLGGLALSADRGHALVRLGGRFAVVAKGKKDLHDLDLSGMTVPRVPADEWWQIFHEVWRRYRDYFYVANMHGYDWEALRERYAPLVQHVRHRSDLNYVLGEMIAELNVGHAYISGGDDGAPERTPVALPGARLAWDADVGRYRIAEILRGENDDEDYRAPLGAVGTDAQQGDLLLAIDGQELQPTDNPYRLLRGKTGRTVRLRLAAAPDAATREVAFQPIASEGKLHYLAWVEQNRARTLAASDGALGYVHLPNMGADGIREFVKQYYPQRDKQGLVIDDRGNGGGNVSQMILNRLSRELLMCTFGRTTGFRPYPQATFLGHLVCLLDETSASDGDIFPAMFRRAGLGPLIGKRSWGGIIGITNRGMLIDGGTVNVPEFGNTEPDGEWTIEGVGVAPDIVVDNDPQALIAGIDPQLEKAIEVLLEKVKQEPRPRPQAPPPPIRTR